MTESQAELIVSISRNIKEIEQIIKSLSAINGDCFSFSPYGPDDVMINNPTLYKYLKDEVIIYYKQQLAYLKKQLENL
jgi:hypothetical protein